MMKRLLYYLFVLFVVSACMLDVDKGADATLEGSLPNDRPVCVTFSLPDVRITPPTKATGDITDEPYLDPERLYVLVCGSSQSIKYIRKAERVGTAEVRADAIPDFPPSILDGYRKVGQGDTTVTVHTFKVLLEVEDQIRTIHFLGNIDGSQLASGDYAYQLLPSLVSQKGKQAFWQKVKSSIMPKKKPNSDEYEIDETTNAYLPSDETVRNLQYIPLIRNYAKIQVTDSTDTFLLYSYAVCNVPSHGSVVPFRSNVPFSTAHPDTGFTFRPPTIDYPDNYRFSGYERCHSGSLDSLEYPGNLPARARIEERLPDESDFLHPEQSEGRVIRYDENADESSAPGFYVYERGAPTAEMEKPTVIIICGRFKRENVPDDAIDPDHDELFYYRLDLMETKKVGTESVSQYYPLYRNFRYNIAIRMITSNGLETPEAALRASKVDDISADFSMRHLSDISNGTTRLLVEPFMAHTYTGPKHQNPDGQRQYYELYARFFNNLEYDVPNRHPYAVTVELEQMEDGGGDILTLFDDDGNEVRSGGFIYPKARDTLGMEGMRLIHFDVKQLSGSTVRTQKIKITGRNYDEEHPEIYKEELRLYREVEITVQPPQSMTVECLTKPLSFKTGSRQTVRVSIPDGLVESMFPLKFTLEAEDMTLTPDNKASNNNLPVISGNSISQHSEYAGKKTFQFVKTLSLDEYNSLEVVQTPDGAMRYFDCVFKSTTSKSATTVWVYNEFFNMGSDSFDNPSTSGEFTEVAFTSYIPRQTGATIPVHIEFTTSEPGQFPEIFVETRGMTIDEMTNYSFTPTSESVNLNFVSIVEDGDVSLSISAASYNPVSIRSHYFRDFGFIDGIKSSSGQSNVVFGYVNDDQNGNKALPFGFRDDVSFPARVSVRNLANDNIFTTLSYSQSTNVAQYQALETGAEDGYHEIEFKTKKNGTKDPLGFRMTAPGYVEETVTFGRFSGNIGNWQSGKNQKVIDCSNVFNPNNSYSFGTGQGKNSFFYFPNPGETQAAVDNLKIKVTFDKISSLDAAKGLVLTPADSSEEEFTMTVESKLAQAPVYYVEITFYDAASVPGSLSATSDDGVTERVWRYPGTGEQRYLWNLAKEDETHAHTITFKSDHTIIIQKIIVKSAVNMTYTPYVAPTP